MLLFYDKVLMRIQAHEHGTHTICVSQDHNLLFSAGKFYPSEASSSDVLVWKLDCIESRASGETQVSMFGRSRAKNLLKKRQIRGQW
jgi:hypothetical protein